MSNDLTDDEIFERFRVLIADEGSNWADSYEMFLADNRTFDPYWQDGVDAIRDNTVDMLVFGRDCMVKVGKESFSGGEIDVNDVLCNLAIAMDRAVRDLVKGKSPTM